MSAPRKPSSSPGPADMERLMSLEEDDLLRRSDGQLFLKTTKTEVWDDFRWRSMTAEEKRACWDEIHGRETEHGGLIIRQKDSCRPLSRIEAMEWIVRTHVPVELERDFLTLLALHHRNKPQRKDGQ